MHVYLKQDVFVKHNAPNNGPFQRRPRSQGQIFWYRHKKWLCAIWKLWYLIFKKLWPMSIFFNWSNVKVNRLSTYKNISSQGIFMWNIKVLALTIHKLLARLKFLKSRSNSQVKITRSKILEPMERYYHMGYSCEISKL